MSVIKSRNNCLNVFSVDICTNILSFLSYKRVLRASCVNKVFDEASKKVQLFELFYKKKFPNLLFSNILIPHQNEKKNNKKITKKSKNIANIDGENKEENLEINEVFMKNTCNNCNFNNTKKKILCQDYPINSNNNNQIIIHNWKALFKEKMIHYHKLQVLNTNNSKKSTHNLCPYVGCYTITKTALQYKKHLNSHS